MTAEAAAAAAVEAVEAVEAVVAEEDKSLVVTLETFESSRALIIKSVCIIYSRSTAVGGSDFSSRVTDSESMTS